MRSLYLHVGPHKTGTTAIQKFMLDQQAQWFNAGMLYPKRYIRIFGHHLFREKLAERDLNDEDIAFFKDSDCDFVISSEDMISLSKADFTYLKQSLPFLQIKPVFSWRRASFKLYSIWQEVIKHGGTQDFYSYYHEHLARPAMSQMLSPDLKLSMFSQVFGSENVIVIDYDASANNKRLLHDFLNALGLQQFEQSASKYEKALSENKAATNASMSIADTETVRALNYMLQDEFEGDPVRSSYQDNKAELEGADLDYVHALIGKHITTGRIGNYAIDVRAEKIMSQQYASQLINYEPSVKAKEAQFPSTDWLMDSKVHECLNRLAVKLKACIIEAKR